MPLQTSGSISLNEIHIEAGGSSGTQATINDSDIRGLTPGSGYTILTGSGTTIDFGDFYGASNIPPVGQQNYLSAGLFTFTVPTGVTSVCVLCIGGGGGGGGSNGGNLGPQGGSGGGLSYRNNLSVTPGEGLSVRVGVGGAGGSNTNNGANGGRSFLKRGTTFLCRAEGGKGGIRQTSGYQNGGAAGTSYSYNTGGGAGGRGGAGGNNTAGGAGGGAGGTVEQAATVDMETATRDKLVVLAAEAAAVKEIVWDQVVAAESAFTDKVVTETLRVI